MQLCCLHANAAAFEVRNHDPQSEAHASLSISVADSLVVLVAVEETDTTRQTTVASAGADRIHEVADQLVEETIVLFPCRELTDDPATESATSKLLDGLAARLDGTVHSVPVGETVAFELDIRGHPFATQWFDVDPEPRADGDWSILHEDGAIEPIAAASLDEPRRSLLRDGELVAPEPADRLFGQSDTGPLLFTDAGRLLPGGVLIRTLVTEFGLDRIREAGSLPIGTAIDAPVGGRDPVSELGLELADLPVSVVSADDSSRDNPSVTTLVPDPESARDTICTQATLIASLLADLSLRIEPIVHASQSFFEEHSDWVATLPAQFEQPLLLERRRDCDWECQLAFAVLDSNQRLLASPAVWIDDTVRAVDSDDAMAVRSTPLGDPSRLVGALARRTAVMDRPQFPTWLAPVQVRLIPLDPAATDRCQEIATDLERSGVRVDIDDRELSISDRLRTADEEWIPYDAVVGSGEPLTVTARAEQTESELTAAELADRITTDCENRPDGARPVPRLYGERPSVLRR